MHEIIRLPGLLSYLEQHHQQVETFPQDRLRFSYVHEGQQIPVGAYVLRSATGNQWLAMAIKICPLNRLRTRSALVANGELPVGALTIIPPEYVALRQTLPLESLLPAQLEQTLRGMATLVVQLKALVDMDGADLETTPLAYIFR